MNSVPLNACAYCSEEVEPDAMDSINGRPAHHACVFRLVAGSAAHILQECPCYGGHRTDPPGMSLRQAAQLALDTYLLLSRKEG